MAEILLNKYM